MLYFTKRLLSVLKCQEQLSFCRFLPLTSPLSSAPLLLLPNPGLRGGKGGFGSLLRAIGAQVHFGILWFEMLCLNVLLFRLRQQPTMRPWGTWPAGGSVMSTMREGSKSKCSIYFHHFRKLNHIVQDNLHEETADINLYYFSDMWMVRQIVRGWNRKRRRQNWRNWEKSQR